ncbi:hypothetical protein MYX84_11050, partial [Acidobacteria bacterium AH-259-O06]|nr:hypothetical protein [Acidobacteria bacterium AH-259-O06]
ADWMPISDVDYVLCCLSSGNGNEPECNASSGSSEKKNKWVYNSGIQEIPLIMVERVHGSRDAVPVTWRSKQLNAIEDILNLIESQLGEEL